MNNKIGARLSKGVLFIGDFLKVHPGRFIKTLYFNYEVKTSSFLDGNTKFTDELRNGAVRIMYFRLWWGIERSKIALRKPA